MSLGSSEGSLLLFSMQTAIYTNYNRSKKSIDELLKILQENCIANHKKMTYNEVKSCKITVSVSIFMYKASHSNVLMNITFFPLN